MEYIDTIDADGNPTGEKKPRNEAHRDGDWHRAVHIWIMSEGGEILIQKRSEMIDSFKNFWDVSVVGHIQSGEKSTDAAVREIKEELGIRAETKELTPLFTIKTQLKDGAFIDNQYSDVYLFHYYGESAALQKQKKEVSEIKFITPKKLEELIQKNSRSFVPRDREYKKIFDVLRGKES